MFEPALTNANKAHMTHYDPMELEEKCKLNSPVLKNFRQGGLLVSSASRTAGSA